VYPVGACLQGLAVLITLPVFLQQDTSGLCAQGSGSAVSSLLLSDLRAKVTASGDVPVSWVDVQCIASTQDSRLQLSKLGAAVAAADGRNLGTLVSQPARTLLVWLALLLFTAAFLLPGA
jgi:hypothetical protein